MVETFKKLPEIRNGKVPEFHSIGTHNWHINRYGHCLYCDLGSKPVQHTLIKKE